MLSQISFTADKNLKNATLKKARAKGITLKSVLIFSMEAFVKGKSNFGMIDNDENEVEEMVFANPSILKNAEKLAKLLK